MSLNVKASEQVAVLAAINPSSQAAGAATSGWVSAANFNKFLALIQTGAFGSSATVDAKIQQAKDGSGTGAKDITGKAITQLVAASNANQQVEIDLDAQELDVSNGFCYIQLSVTVGVAATQTAASVIGFNPRFAPASSFNATSVAQVAG